MDAVRLPATLALLTVVWLGGCLEGPEDPDDASPAFSRSIRDDLARALPGGAEGRVLVVEAAGGTGSAHTVSLPVHPTERNAWYEALVLSDPLDVDYLFLAGPAGASPDEYELTWGTAKAYRRDVDAQGQSSALLDVTPATSHFIFQAPRGDGMDVTLGIGSSEPTVVLAVWPITGQRADRFDPDREVPEIKGMVLTWKERKEAETHVLGQGAASAWLSHSVSLVPEGGGVGFRVINSSGAPVSVEAKADAAAATIRMTGSLVADLPYSRGYIGAGVLVDEASKGGIRVTGHAGGGAIDAAEGTDGERCTVPVCVLPTGTAFWSTRPDGLGGIELNWNITFEQPLPHLTASGGNTAFMHLWVVGD